MPAKVIAGSLALTGFAVAILAGLAAGNAASTILWTALVAGFVCWVLGVIVGAVAYKAVTEHVENYKAENPINPKLDADAEANPGAAIEIVEDSQADPKQQADAA